MNSRIVGTGLRLGADCLMVLLLSAGTLLADPLVVRDDFNDGVINPQIWQLIGNSDPGVQVVEQNGYLRIFGQRSFPDLQTGLTTRDSYDAINGLDIRVMFQALRPVSGFTLELNDINYIYPPRYHITLRYYGETYIFSWCAFGLQVPDGCRVMGQIPSFGTEESNYSQLRITYDGKTRRVTGSVMMGTGEWATERKIGTAQLPIAFGPFVARVFAQSGESFGFPTGLVDYRLDDFELTVGK